MVAINLSAYRPLLAEVESVTHHDFFFFFSSPGVKVPAVCGAEDGLEPADWGIQMMGLLKYRVSNGVQILILTHCTMVASHVLFK